MQCCGSGMFIPDPDFYPSWIPDLGSRISDPGSKNINKRDGWKKFVIILFFLVTNFTKLNLILLLKCWRKKNWANFQRIIEVFTQKFFIKLLKIWVWDPGSEIRDPEKTYSGSRGQKGTGSRIPDPDPQHWINAIWAPDEQAKLVLNIESYTQRYSIT
jgi:hypothetical protein